MITATYREIEVEILDANDDTAEVVTIGGEKLFRIISSSSACKHGAEPIVWLTGGKVGVEELTNVRCDGIRAEEHMIKLFGDRVGMRTLKMAGAEVSP